MPWRSTGRWDVLKGTSRSCGHEPDNTHLVRGHLSLKSSAGNSHQAFQGGKLPRHPGKVASYVPCYVLRVLWPHSSTSLTPCATKASVRPPEPLPSSVGALPS